MRDALVPVLSDPSLCKGAGRIRRLIFGVVLAVALTASFLVPPNAVGSSTAAENWRWDVLPGEDSDLFPLVGEITFRGTDGRELDSPPEAIGVDAGLGTAVFIDEDDRQVFLVDTETLGYTTIPDPGSEHVVSETAVIDETAHRLIMFGPTGSEALGEDDIHGCEPVVPFVVGATCGATDATVFGVTFIDLLGHSGPRTVELALTHFGDKELDRQVGFEVAAPLDYHPASGNLYLATHRPSVPFESSVIGSAASRRTVLHEIPLDAVVDNGLDNGDLEPTWSFPLESCSRVSNKGDGALVRSEKAEFIYVACEGGGTSPHGVARVDLIPGQDASDTSRFRATFDPLVGDISDGKVSVDSDNDLVLIQIVLFGPRLFVYDAYRRAWTGAIELSQEGGENQATPATDSRTGRVYTFSAGSGELRVNEGVWPSVPNSSGPKIDYDLGNDNPFLLSRDAPLVDGGTQRLFIDNFAMCLEVDAEESCVEEEGTEGNPDPPHFRVFEDRLSIRPPPPVHPDYDSRTSDLPEEPDLATSTAAGNAKAFGARHLMVGGTGNASYATPETNNQTERRVRSAPLGAASRDLIRGQVLGANLSRISSPSTSALATGLHLAAEQTKQDLQRNSDVRCASSRAASRLQGEAECLPDDWQSDDPHETEQELQRRWDGSSWPDEYPAEMRGRSAYCDDFGGEPSDDAKPGSAVACDSTVPQVSAGALFSPSEENASAGGETPGLHVGYAESSTDIYEDDTLGMVSTASAVARDVDLFGQVSIGEVRTEATAVAHGRPGTASTELVREYRQVRIGDFSCGWQEDDPCDLYEVAHQINEQLGPKVVARVPAQDTFLNPEAGDKPDAQTGAAQVSNGTPGGAKALVTLDPYAYQSGLTINNDNHSELPGLEITVYHDNDRTSRQILQLAAVELDATYQISPVPTWDPPDWGSGEGTGGDDGLGLDDGLSDTVGGAATRSIVPPPPFAHLSQDPPSPTDPEDSTATAGDTGQGSGEFAESEGGEGTVSQGEAPSLGTADGSAVSTGDDVPAPEVASDASGEQPAVAQGGQSSSSGPGGLMLTRQRMGETVPLAVLWVLAALPFYLAVRRRRLTASTRT